MKILVLNSGSSSLKYQLFDIQGDNYNIVAKGLAERIGIDGSFVSIKIAENDKITKTLPLANHSEAISVVFELLLNGALKNMEELHAVGHRVVHGGEEFAQSVIIDEKVINTIDRLSMLAPLHNPANLIGIKAISKLLPNIKQVAVFDTAFHQTMPKESFLYALPLEQYSGHQIRKYGFHGTSHYFVANECAKLIGKAGKIITCHLGNGASISAVENGKCKDTSMGFTPLAGVIMGTRSGDIDPYIPLFIMKYQNKSLEEANDILNKKSGMLGLSGFSDMRDVEDNYIKGDKQTRDAMNCYVYAIVKYIGSYVASLGGVDAIVFTAGIGENSSLIRSLIIERLAYLGIELNVENNNKRGEVLELSKAGSKVKVFVIPTNEELVIAQDTKRLA